MNVARIGYVEVDVGGSAVLLFDSGSGWPPTPAHLRVYVADLDAAVHAAVSHGGRVVTEPTEVAFGDVVARVRDGQGHLWWIRQRVEDVDPVELGRRFAQPEPMTAMTYVGDTVEAEMAGS